MNNSRILAWFSAPLMALMISSGAKGAPWIEASGDLQVNWSSLTARFSGVASSSPGDREGLKGLERAAWRQGYEAAGPRLEQVLREQFARSAAGGKTAEGPAVAGAVDEIRKTIKSLNVTFFASGAVEVAMEATLNPGLSAALRESGAGSKSIPPGNDTSDATGVVLKVPGSARPSATFWLVDASGDVLFEPAMVSHSAVSQGAMGRWYRSPEALEVSKFAGEKPEVLTVTEIRDGNRLVVDRLQFSKLGATALRALADGKAVLSAR